MWEFIPSTRLPSVPIVYSPSAIRSPGCKAVVILACREEVRIINLDPPVSAVTEYGLCTGIGYAWDNQVLSISATHFIHPLGERFPNSLKEGDDRGEVPTAGRIYSRCWTSLPFSGKSFCALVPRCLSPVNRDPPRGVVFCLL